ncbi:hypothetical protein QOZ80_1AG0041980 [Eleusine coracana subsp. coracana]|nr:hypothetical protein QOZ80_1AG0041980 [Eleusine coracana subsp. coracana]
MSSSSSDEAIFQMEFEPPSSPEGISMHHQTTCNILEAVLGPTTQVEMAIHQRAMQHVREIGEERNRSSLKKRLMMRLQKDGYDASLCMSSWVATSQHPGGDYEYIDVVVAAEGGAAAGTTSRLVVDIDFRAQFQVARPAPWYAHLWSQLPPVFVGPRAKLHKAVSLLCAAAQRSLRESGLQVPPWRKSSYMHAKWLPSGEALPAGGRTPAATGVAQWSVAKERSCGPRRSGGLSMELSGSNAEPNGCQAGSIWA